MTNKKMGKNGKIYECIICDFKTIYNSNYDKHLTTAKHKRLTNTNKKPIKNGAAFSCICGKTYKHPSSLCKHKKTCPQINNTMVIQENPNGKPSVMDIISQNKDIMDALVLQNEELMKKNDELTNTIIKQSNTIQEMVPKIGNNNTTNTTNNNNQFNLQVFLNEDCKDAINFSDFIKQIQVSFEDIENQAECGYVKGISKLFIESLKGLGTHKRPIHCTDKKRKTLYIKENNEWDKEGSQDILLKGIQEVTRSTMRTLINEKVVQAEEFADMESDFSKKCLVIQRNLIPTPPRETAFSKVMENITKNSGIME
jgi:hypothetical protein